MQPSAQPVPVQLSQATAPRRRAGHRRHSQPGPEPQLCRSARAPLRLVRNSRSFRTQSRPASPPAGAGRSGRKPVAAERPAAVASSIAHFETFMVRHSNPWGNGVQVCPSHDCGGKRAVGWQGRESRQLSRLHCQICYRSPSRRKLTPKSVQKTRYSQPEPTARQTLTATETMRCNGTVDDPFHRSRR